MVKKIIIGVIICGCVLGLIQLFGGNVFGFISWCFDWLVYSVEWVANKISGNDMAQQAFHTKPSDLGTIMFLPIIR